MESFAADWTRTRPASLKPRDRGPSPAKADGAPADGGPREPPAGACRLAQEIASAFFAIPVCEIERPGRASAPVSEARHVAMYLAHVVFQIPLSAMAEGFGRDRTTIAYAIRRIEDRRDDHAFDSIVERLECLAHAVRLALDAHGARCEEGNR